MVRLIPVEQRGVVTWIEDAPTQCPAGHAELVPTWTGCAVCGGMCRHWECRAAGCTAPALIDDEHVHGAGR